MGSVYMDTNNILNWFFCRENSLMSKNIMISDDVYVLLESKTNKLGGRDPKKIGFSRVIERALYDQEQYQKRKTGKKT